MNPDAGITEWSPSPERPLEIAQVVWLHALEAQRHDSSAATLELAQRAGSDPSTLRHALALGRARQKSPATDRRIPGACRRLEQAIALVSREDRSLPTSAPPAIDDTDRAT